MKICSALQKENFDVLLIGRRLPDSLDLPLLNYRALRMRLYFKSGVLFYLFFNLRLFFRLLFTRADLLYSNDLDTLLPNFLMGRIKNIPVIYDSHELFCDVPELLENPGKRKVWMRLENFLVPKLKYCITVNQSIASILQLRYSTPFSVVRNIPEDPGPINFHSRKDLRLPEDKKILILQGTGINIDRGAEELVDAMHYLEGCFLIIIGSGDVWPILESKTAISGLSEKIRLIKKIPKNELLHFTHHADLGISIDKDTNPNYYNSLPNKIFDYMHAGVPVLASRLPEIENLISEFKLGDFIDNHEPTHIAEKVKQILDSPHYQEMRKNALLAAKKLSWNQEEQILRATIKAASQEGNSR
jgi:glycosyltransferase involved in cell wall biosynthesis